MKVAIRRRAREIRAKRSSDLSKSLVLGSKCKIVTDLDDVDDPPSSIEVEVQNYNGVGMSLGTHNQADANAASKELRVSNLSFCYTGRRTGVSPFELRDVSLTCPTGRVTCLVGPSGSGKSTILKLVSGELPVRFGEIVLGSKSLNTIPFGRRGTSTVFQDVALLPYLSALENVRVGPVAARRNEREANSAALYWLETLGIEHLANRLVGSMSGGERQRVAIARALAAEPHILLMDEPTSSLDMLATDQLVGIIDTIKQTRPSSIILVVTHDREFCLRIADQIAVLDGGSLLWSGPPDGLSSLPTNPRVYEIVGTSVLLRGTAEQDTFVLDRVGNDFSDLTIQFPPGKLVSSGDLVVVAPRIAVYVGQAANVGKPAILIPGRVVNFKIGVNGEFNYDIRLANGQVLRALTAASSDVLELSLNQDVEVSVLLSAIRVLRVE